MDRSSTKKKWESAWTGTPILYDYFIEERWAMLGNWEMSREVRPCALITIKRSSRKCFKFVVLVKFMWPVQSWAGGKRSMISGIWRADSLKKIWLHFEIVSEMVLSIAARSKTRRVQLEFNIWPWKTWARIGPNSTHI